MTPLFVKVASSRSLPIGPWKVLSRDNVHYTLQHPVSKEKVHLYIAHTHEDFETKRLGFEARKELADTLGNRLKRKGKR